MSISRHIDLLPAINGLPVINQGSRRIGKHGRNAFLKERVIGKLNDKIAELPSAEHMDPHAVYRVFLLKIDHRPADRIFKGRVCAETRPIVVHAVRHNAAERFIQRIAPDRCAGIPVRIIAVHRQLFGHIETLEYSLLIQSDIDNLSLRVDVLKLADICPCTVAAPGHRAEQKAASDGIGIDRLRISRCRKLTVGGIIDGRTVIRGCKRYFAEGRI